MEDNTKDLKNLNDKDSLDQADNRFETVIGLETHVELSTQTKMFCGCRLSFGEKPNSNTCPVCLGHPGSLPVVNKKAVEYAMKIALALNCRINEHTIFHRKNYFYPDMPKNYQISQYNLPIGIGGYIEINMGSRTRRVGITRVHMEEDAGKLVHSGTTGRISEADYSIGDFNRAGTPLIEIVTEPEIRSPLEAKQYMITLRNILLYLGVSDCSMEEGSLRCDANISVKLKDSDRLGTRTEIKNLNSFKFIQKALEYEVSRQISVINSGKKVIQQTRHYDDKTQSTKVLRSKEEAHDYRYFPDPDLVPIDIDDCWIKDIKDSIPELPDQKGKRYKDRFGLSDYDSSLLSGDFEISDYFEKTLETYNANPKGICNWLMGDFSAFLNKDQISIRESRIKPEHLACLVRLIDEGKISSKAAKSIFEEMYAKGSVPGDIIKEKGLEQISDEGELEAIVEEAVKNNPDAVSQYRAGKVKAIGFIVGQVMQKTKGKANPALVNEIIIKKIS